jgi:hypothetical protein
MTTITIIAALLAVLWFLWSWFKWHKEQRGDQNELDCLEEIVQSFESGRYENPEYIKRQISDIESHHKTLSREAKRLLYRARCAIELRENSKGNPL